MKISNSKRGFTLVELLVYMGIFSILLIVLMQLFTTILSTHLESEATSSLSQDGNYLTSRFAYDIHGASTVTSPALGASCTWPTLPTCQLQITDGVTSKTYTMDNSANLSLTTSGHTDQLNSANTKVTGITFTTLGNNPGKASVQIKLTLESRTIRPGNLVQTASFQTTVGTR